MYPVRTTIIVLVVFIFTSGRNFNLAQYLPLREQPKRKYSLCREGENTLETNRTSGSVEEQLLYNFTCPPYISYAKLHLPPSAASEVNQTRPHISELMAVMPKCIPRSIPRRIYDLVMYCGELSMLKLRLEELKPVVYTHILLESGVDQALKRKPLHYKDKHARFISDHYSIRHFVVDFNPKKIRLISNFLCHEEWIVENLQREVGVHGLFDAHGDDLLIVTDLDEIPIREVVDALRWCDYTQPIANLPMRIYFYHLGCLREVYWTLPVVIKVSHLKTELVLSSKKSGKKATSRWITSFETNKYYKHRKFCQVRINIYAPLLPSPSGWHLTFFGGPAKITQKISHYAHQETNTPEVNNFTWAKQVYHQCLNLFRGIRIKIHQQHNVFRLFYDVSVLPHALYDHPQRYADFIPKEMFPMLRICQRRSSHLTASITGFNDRKMTLGCCPRSTILIRSAVWYDSTGYSSDYQPAGPALYQLPASKTAASNTTVGGTCFYDSAKEYKAECDGKLTCEIFTALPVGAVSERCFSKGKVVKIVLSCIF